MKGYLRKYSILVHQMVRDYKVYAINAFITEKFCMEADKFKYSSSKHK